MTLDSQTAIEETQQSSEQPSPKWNAPTKALVGFIFMGLIAFFFIRFSDVMGPLLLAFLLTYLLYPVVIWLKNRVKLPWGVAVGLVVVLVVLVLLGLLAISGLTLVEQSKGLITFLQNTLADLPEMLEDLNNQVVVLGPFEYPLSNLNLNLDTLGRQLVSSIQPLFSRLGSIVTSIASGAASVVGALVLVVLLTYFILLENRGRPYRLLDVQIPGYEKDIEQIGLELQRIWNGFMRGQITMVAIIFVIYSILLNTLGVRFAFGLALMAGFARFVPWVGTAVTWTIYFMVALLQGSTAFGLQPFAYALLVTGVAILMDPVIDSMITPKIMGNALQVHPAMLLVGVLVGTTWLGFIGLLLAGPVLATFKLFATYALRKSFDLDPWENIGKSRRISSSSGPGVGARVWQKIKDVSQIIWQKIREFLQKRNGSQEKDKSKNGK